MEKKSLAVIGVAVLLAGVGLGLELLTSKDYEKKGSQTTANATSVVDVDAVLEHPERFIGSIGVGGSVTHLDEEKSMFTLGCEDACLVMPVKFNGRLPEQGTDVIAYGEIQKTEGGRYIFVAREVVTR